MTSSENAGRHDSPARPGGTRLSVLIAEDEPMIQRALARFLERRGHRVQVASNAHAALELIRLAPPDAALVDVRMPGGGMSVVAGLSDSRDFDGRIVVMTGGEAEDHVEAVRDGIDFLPKPFSLTRLAELLEGREAVLGTPEA